MWHLRSRCDVLRPYASRRKVHGAPSGARRETLSSTVHVICTQPAGQGGLLPRERSAASPVISELRSEPRKHGSLPLSGKAGLGGRLEERALRWPKLIFVRSELD